MERAPQRVLLADDSKFLRAAHELFLKKDGFMVIKAGDGEEALQLARRELPDIIVLDLLMPKLGGMEVLKALKQDASTSQIPVIILSGLSQKNEDMLSQAGAAAYIEKSKFGPESLPRFVRHVLQPGNN
jgi:twitching motility two-component system response regulator PilH